MTTFLCSDLVKEMVGRESLGYVLKQNEYFFLTGYKILQKQGENGFLRFRKILYNGKIKLVYNISEYKRLYNFMGTFSTQNYISLIAELVEILVEIKYNGFIQVETVDLAYDKIFLDANYRIHLICVPLLIESTTETMHAFEGKAKQVIAEILERSGLLNDYSLSNLYGDCKEEGITIDDLYSKINMKGYYNHVADNGIPKGNGGQGLLFTPQVRLVGINTNANIRVDKADFVLGKSQGMADGIVEDSSAVSRKHCKVVWNSGTNYIVDLGSLNHTYVNGNELIPGEYNELCVGDTIKLANVEFSVNKEA